MIAWLHSFRKWCWITFAIGLLGAGWGLFSPHRSFWLVGAGLAAMIGVALIIAARRWRYRNRQSIACGNCAADDVCDSPETADQPSDGPSHPARQRVPFRVVDSADDEQDAPVPTSNDPNECQIHEFVDSLMRAGRYSLLLRPQIASGLTPELLALARKRLEQQMSLVSEGEVLVEPHLIAEEPLSDAELIAARGKVVRVGAFYLDRFAVTNRQFQIFLNSGGYDQVALWDAAIWPAVVDFIDATGHPGPRYWQHGRFPPGKADHPVVGVSWYEAAAYARWVGKRLPSDAEWLKAGCWPVQPSPKSRVQRRFPWGNAMDRSRANLWGTGPGDTAAVDDFTGGASVGGISQLIGNVWEWTAAEFELPTPPRSRREASRRAAVGPTPSGPDANPAATTPAATAVNAASVGPLPASVSSIHQSNGGARPPLKTLRGGAFDTYFDHHASCQFASGDSPLARKYNVGFRLAIGTCDLIVLAGSHVDGEGESDQTPADENAEDLQPA